VKFTRASVASLWPVGQVCDLAFRLAEAAYSTACVRKAG